MFEWIVALRFLREGRFQSTLIIGGVAIGVAVVVFISALIAGLQANTVRRTLGSQAHIVVRPIDEATERQVPDRPGVLMLPSVQPREQRLRSIDQWQAVMPLIERLPGVSAVSPMAAGPGTVTRGEARKAVAIAGVEPERYQRIINIDEKMVGGVFRVLPGETVLGVELASDLGVGVGDRIRLQTRPEIAETYTVRGLIDLGLRDLNRRTVYLGLRDAQTLLDLPGGVSNLDIAVTAIFAAETIAREIQRVSGLKVESWMQTNSQLLAALNAQTVTSTMIRVFTMVIVALGIASVLVVSVVQKRKEIGILRAIGASRARMQRVFLLQGMLVSVIGSVLGSLLAIGLLLVFTWTVKNADGSPLFPVEFDPTLFATAALVAIVCGVAAAYAPARSAARLDPAAAIRG